MRTLALLFTLAACPDALAADEKTVLATGDWSEPVNGLRGRLVLAQGRTLGDGKIRESLVYVEVENVTHTSSGEVNLYFDPDALKCELTAAAGKAVPPTPVAGSGGRPGKTWVTIPFDSSVRLRTNPYAFGRAEGLLIPLNNTAWHVKDDADYFLSGALTVTPPAGKADAWKGALKLPKAKVSMKPAKKDAPAEPTQHPKAGEWSEKKDGLVARLRLVKDDDLRSVKVLLEVNNFGGFGAGSPSPASRRSNCPCSTPTASR